MTEETTEEKLDIQVALERVLKTARARDKLARGLREVCKAIESKSAILVLIAKTCNDDTYVKCLKALCNDYGKDLGAWCGLCRRNKEGKIAKVIKCSSCAIKKDGLDLTDEASQVVRDAIKHSKN